jgi:hypothetical protein
VKLWFAILALSAACAPSPPASSQPGASPIVEVTPRASSSEPSPVAPAVLDAPKMQATPAVSGWLSLTKGAQPVIGGRMLQSDTMAKFFGQDWRALKGRRFRVYGEIHDHQCDPRAQCLVEGVIPIVRNVTSIELCQGCAAAPTDVKAVACTPDKAGCAAICERHGELCRSRVGSNAKHMQRCDSQIADCREGCQRYGDPDPHCQ